MAPTVKAPGKVHFNMFVRTEPVKTLRGNAHKGPHLAKPGETHLATADRTLVTCARCLNQKY